MIRTVDLNILGMIQQHLKCDFLDKTMPIVTTWGNLGVLWIVVAGAMLFCSQTRVVGIQIIIALVTGVLIGNLCLKNLIARKRPFLYSDDIILLISKPKDYSFPSGHTLSSFTAAFTIYMWDKQWGIIALGVACVIAFSRMYLYVHFPTDILGGILLAVLVAILAKEGVDYWFHV